MLKPQTDVTGNFKIQSRLPEMDKNMAIASTSIRVHLYTNVMIYTFLIQSFTLSLGTGLAMGFRVGLLCHVH